MAGPEAKVEAYLTKIVKGIGGLSYKWAPTRSGLPDRILVMPQGTVTFVEVKAENGVISDLQKIEHEKLALRGVTVEIVWDKSGVDSLVARLLARDKRSALERFRVL